MILGERDYDSTHSLIISKLLKSKKKKLLPEMILIMKYLIKNKQTIKVKSIKLHIL